MTAGCGSAPLDAPSLRHQLAFADSGAMSNLRLLLEVNGARVFSAAELDNMLREEEVGYRTFADHSTLKNLDSMPRDALLGHLGMYYTADSMRDLDTDRLRLLLREKLRDDLAEGRMHRDARVINELRVRGIEPTTEGIATSSKAMVQRLRRELQEEEARYAEEEREFEQLQHRLGTYSEAELRDMWDEAQCAHLRKALGDLELGMDLSGDQTTLAARYAAWRAVEQRAVSLLTNVEPDDMTREELDIEFLRRRLALPPGYESSHDPDSVRREMVARLKQSLFEDTHKGPPRFEAVAQFVQLSDLEAMDDRELTRHLLRFHRRAEHKFRDKAAKVRRLADIIVRNTLTTYERACQDELVRTMDLIRKREEGGARSSSSSSSSSSGTAGAVPFNPMSPSPSPDSPVARNLFMGGGGVWGVSADAESVSALDEAPRSPLSLRVPAWPSELDEPEASSPASSSAAGSPVPRQKKLTKVQLLTEFKASFRRLERARAELHRLNELDERLRAAESAAAAAAAASSSSSSSSSSISSASAATLGTAASSLSAAAAAAAALGGGHSALLLDLDRSTSPVRAGRHAATPGRRRRGQKRSREVSPLEDGGDVDVDEAEAHADRRSSRRLARAGVSLPASASAATKSARSRVGSGRALRSASRGRRLASN